MPSRLRFSAMASRPVPTAMDGAAAAGAFGGRDANIPGALYFQVVASHKL